MNHFSSVSTPNEKFKKKNISDSECDDCRRSKIRGDRVLPVISQSQRSTKKLKIEIIKKLISTSSGTLIVKV